MGGILLSLLSRHELGLRAGFDPQSGVGSRSASPTVIIQAL